MNATTTAAIQYSTIHHRAFIGGALSLTAGLVVGTASFLGFSDSIAAQVLTKCMTSWIDTITYHKLFSKLLTESTESHSNGPLNHLRLLNKNAPESLSTLSASLPTRSTATTSPLLFVHSRCT
ncbi:hypothetical protein BDC45DRAFT_572283 [Circinella umbellata]|nr:hypothetical protein BDC45DRAFT_572283 [Circinella umbellata]